MSRPSRWYSRAGSEWQFHCSPFLLRYLHLYQFSIHLPALSSPPVSFETQQLHSCTYYYPSILLPSVILNWQVCKGDGVYLAGGTVGHQSITRLTQGQQALYTYWQIHLESLLQSHSHLWSVKHRLTCLSLDLRHISLCFYTEIGKIILCLKKKKKKRQWLQSCQAL